MPRLTRRWATFRAWATCTTPHHAAVDKAYEACGGKKTYRNDAERVAFLFDLY